MSDTISRFPLQWPVGWRRQETAYRTPGRFGKKAVRENGWRPMQDITLHQASGRLLQELERMGIHADDVVLSTNVPTRLDGMPRSDAKAPADPGAAVYWVDGGARRCMAIDQYTKVEMNVAALAATIEAMRAIERHGGAAILDRAFTGFAQLPAPAAAGTKRPWREVLGLAPGHSYTAEHIRQAYRLAASKCHPDRGGTDAQMAELNLARDEAFAAVGDA